MARQLGDHPDDVRAGVRQCHERREAHVLGADDQRPSVETLPAKRHQLLHRPRGHDAGGSRSGHEAGRARALPAAGRQHDGGGCEHVAPGWPRQLEMTDPGPARDHRLLLNARSRPACVRDVAAGVTRARHEAVHVAHAEALMV